MFRKITLEVSLKPFKTTTPEAIRAVCEKIFDQWHPLLIGREVISVMLWAADGSELLDYTGELDKSFEWCRFVGTANLKPLGEGEPKETSLHERRQDYIESAPVMTYRILRDIVSTLRAVGKRRHPEAVIRVGETFDIGPEFALSDFKYRRHTEITSGAKIDRLGFVDATATLRGDSYPYAAYPDGIPEGLPFGSFLGAQTKAFFLDMGFDYLWLSNGLGFSSNPWDKTGKIFDGESYRPEKLAETKARVFEFWKLFREACPDIPLEVRGTNNSVGIDYSSDGVPLWDIYNSKLGITAPPNSPWAAINGNYGLELMGHMTRICELPSESFPFRYYIHDPWWINSPWYDRYDGTPCDIYMPAMISRITREGEIESANCLGLLSVDNSYGELPAACANEAIPHLLKAEKNAPDEPAPIVWVYPMREYTTATDEEKLRRMNEGDNFISDAINGGFPLCSVTSTDSFLHHSPTLYKKSVILTPLPESAAVCDKLFEMAAAGIGIIAYGSQSELCRARLPENAVRVYTGGAPQAMLSALSHFGYSVSFDKKDEGATEPTITVSRYDGALMFSVCNTNTTTSTELKFPLGAPILIGIDAEIKDGAASYRFARSEHRECRIFVKQSEGVITCRESAPVNARYRRSIRITGLHDATVYFFTEKGRECSLTRYRGDDTPYFDLPIKTGYDERQGEYIFSEKISGEVYFIIGHKNTKV